MTIFKTIRDVLSLSLSISISLSLSVFVCVLAIFVYFQLGKRHFLVLINLKIYENLQNYVA